MAGGRHPHPEALYYHIAGDALEMAKTENDHFRKKGLITTCMVFSALCLETYINQAFHSNKETQKILEDDDRMALETKWLMLPLLLGSPITFNKGEQPYQIFSELIKTRNNRLVHFKPTSETDTTVSPIKKTYFIDLISDISIAQKYWNCISEMIHKLHHLTGGKTEFPEFLTGSRYTNSMWADFTIPIG